MELGTYHLSTRYFYGQLLPTWWRPKLLIKELSLWHSFMTKMTAFPWTCLLKILSAAVPPLSGKTFCTFWLANSYSSFRTSSIYYILYLDFFVTLPSSPRVAKCPFTKPLECPTHITITEFSYWIGDVYMWLSSPGFWAPWSQKWCLDFRIPLYIAYQLAHDNCSNACSPGLSRGGWEGKMLKRQGENPTKRFESTGRGENKDAMLWASFEQKRHL